MLIQQWGEAAICEPNGPEPAMSIGGSLASVPPGPQRDAVLQAMLVARPPHAVLVASLADCFTSDPQLRQRLFLAQRWTVYVAALRGAFARGQLVTLDTPARIQIARHLFDMGRPALVRLVVPPGSSGLEDPELRVAASRALAVLADRSVARQLLAPDEAAMSWPERLLHAWYDAANGATPDPVFLRHLLDSLLPRPSLPAQAVIDASDTPEAVTASLVGLARCGTDGWTWIEAGEAQDVVPGLPAALAKLSWMDLALAEAETGADAPGAWMDALLSSHFGEWDEGRMRFAVRSAALNRLQAAGQGVAFPDPFSDGIVRARRSFMFGPNHFAHVYVAADPARSFTVLSLCWNLFRRDVLLLPQAKLAVVLSGRGGMPDPAPAVGQLLAFIGRNAEAVRRLLSAPPRPALVSGLNPNIGHHYHNELAALEGLHGAVADMPSVLAPNDYFDLAALHRLRAEPQRCALEALPQHCLERGLSPFWPSTVGAPARLGHRVIAFAESRAAAVAHEMREMLGPHGRAVLFMLRSNRRIWASQREGVRSAVTQLARRHRITHIMFDGVTRTNPEDPNERRWIEAEHALVEELRDDLKDIPNLVIVSLVGRTMAEKIVAHGFVRFAVAPKGNGALPNLSWVRNLLVVEHGNAFDLPQAMVEARYREDAVLPLLVDRDAIRDDLGEAMDRGEEHFGADVQLQASYDLDLPALLGLIEEATLRTA